jgi:ATP phosphoribosyltransferase regulatory subunit HisZ
VCNVGVVHQVVGPEEGHNSIADNRQGMDSGQQSIILKAAMLRNKRFYLDVIFQAVVNTVMNLCGYKIEDYF